MRFRRKILIVTGGLIAVAVVAGVITWRQLATSSTAVSLSSAVHEFKRIASPSSGMGPPRPGVYTFALHGKECAGIAGLQLCRTFPSTGHMILTRKSNTITIEVDLSQE